MKSNHSNSSNIGDIIKLVTIMTVLAIIAGSIALVSGSFKVIKTAANLAVLNDNIQFYNESVFKTDEMTEEAEEWIQIRSEKYYHSDDVLVRIYSNQNAFIKIAIAVSAFLAIPATLLMDGYYFLQIVRKCLKEVYRKKRLHQLHQSRQINGRR